MLWITILYSAKLTRSDSPVGIYIYIYIERDICIFIYLCLFIFVCMYLYLCLYIHIYIYANIMYMRSWRRSPLRKTQPRAPELPGRFPDVYIYIYVYLSLSLYIYIHIHMYDLDVEVFPLPACVAVWRGRSSDSPGGARSRIPLQGWRSLAGVRAGGHSAFAGRLRSSVCVHYCLSFVYYCYNTVNNNTTTL